MNKLFSKTSIISMLCDFMMNWLLQKFWKLYDLQIKIE